MKLRLGVSKLFGNSHVLHYFAVETQYYMATPVDLIRFNAWANKKISDQVASIPADVVVKEFGGSFPSMRALVLHLLQADWRWFNRWNGIPIADVPEQWQKWNVGTLITEWMQVELKMVNRVIELAHNESLPIKFTTAKGVKYETAFTDTVTHVVNHGTYHRGQIVNMIRMAGFTPVSTDYFLYSVERDAK